MKLNEKYKFNLEVSSKWKYIDEEEPEDCDSCIVVAYDEISSEYWLFSGLYNQDAKRWYDGFGHLDLKDGIAWLSIADDLKINPQE